MKSNSMMKSILSVVLLLLMLFAAMGTSTKTGRLQHRNETMEEQLQRLEREAENLETRILDLEKRMANLKQSCQRIEDESLRSSE